MVHRSRLAALAGLVLVAACGGGGSNSGNAPSAATSSQYAQRCAPTHPYASPGLSTGSLGIEKQWLRAYFDEAYLWRDEVPTVNANAPAYSSSDIYDSLDNYFEALKTPALTASNARRDRFSFTYPTAAWRALSQDGVQAGFGIEWLVLSSTVPRRVRIAYVEPNSPAALAGLQRGDTLVSVDGVSIDDTTPAGIAALNLALAPSGTGMNVRFVLSRNASLLPEATLGSTAVVKTPVPLRRVVTANGRRFGYLLFNDHLVTSEVQLIEAVTYLQGQAIDELVLDLRYNGGGFLYIASELAHMVAGRPRTDNQVFERLTFSARRVAESNSPDAVTPFYNTSCVPDASFRCTQIAALPTLNLSRVYVLTQASTCSASESIINSLRGVGVEVRQIGRATCGKPYGFTARDNCGISYFPIEFKGANALGFGDYADGFLPGGSGAAGVPGCGVDDDLERPLGDATEALLATAISHRTTGTCPVGASVSREQAQGVVPAPSAGVMLRSPLRENRLLAPQR